MRTSKRVRREAKELFRDCMVNGVLDENRARRTATIESATPLPADLRVAVEAGLTRLYGPGLTTAFAYRTALIGGLRIQVGSDVYDGSVLARLATLQRSF